MAALPNCPLDPNMFLQLALPMGSSHLEAIENHISTNNCPHPPLKELVFDGRIKGTTLLLLACHYGEFESVKRIVDSWGVNVRAAATYFLLPPPFMLGMKIESATPLFVAAFQGHSRIVRYLLEKGADVTATTSNKTRPEFDGLTPLYGAVSDQRMLPYRREQLEEQRAERNIIVLSLLEFGADLSTSNQPSNGYPMWMNRLCGVDTTITLINHGLDLQYRNPSSAKTILQYWVMHPDGFTVEDSLKIVKILFEKGAHIDMMERDNLGYTPIIKVVYSIDLIQLNPLALFDYLLERHDIVIMEKIEAMEFAGAYILFFSEENAPQLHNKAFEYWRRATHLRQTEGTGSYQKKLLHTDKTLGTVEWTTLDQLEHIIQRSSKNEIQIQLFLVQLRILSSRSREAFKEFVGEYMLMIEEPHGERSHLKLLFLLNVYWSMLDQILLFQPSEKGIWNTSVGVISNLVDDLMKFKRSNPTLLNLEIMKKSIHLILATDPLRLADRARETYTESNYSRSMFRFLTMLLDLPQMLLDDIWSSLLELFRHLGSDQLGSLLLLACKDYKNVHYFFTIRLLLQLGAKVDAFYRNGNRPLHLVAKGGSKQSEAAGCLLLGYGAQLFRINNFGKSAVDLWIERNEKDQKGEEGADADSRERPDWCRTVRKLKCLSASCIRVHDVPYKDEPEFFKDSHSFIKKH